MRKIKAPASPTAKRIEEGTLTGLGQLWPGNGYVRATRAISPILFFDDVAACRRRVQACRAGGEPVRRRWLRPPNWMMSRVAELRAKSEELYEQGHRSDDAEERLAMVLRGLE